MNTEKWNSSMQTNALLISGPFKTADIEKTLVYGVHGSIAGCTFDKMKQTIKEL